MKKFNLTRMASVYISAALVTSLSFALFACSDDPSPVAPNPLSGGESSAVALSSEMAMSSSSIVEESSSSVANALSSSVTDESSSSIVGSSSAVFDPSRVIVTDAVIQCDSRRTMDDPMLDGVAVAKTLLPEKSDAAIPPVVYRYVTLEDVGFTIKNISMTCDVVIDSLEVSASDSTLYVNVKSDYENAKRCLCKSEIFFKVKTDSVYYSAKELVLNDGGNINFDNKMMIVDLDVVRVEDVPKVNDD